jgi:hypothetical protein
MLNVKMSEDKLLEEIKAKIFLLTGEKINQQELIDKCLKYSYNHFEDFIQEEIRTPKLSKNRIQQILSNTVKFKDYIPEKTDDEVIYGL